MLAIALASMRARRTQPILLGRIRIQSFRAHDAHSCGVMILAYVAWSLIPFAPNIQRCPFNQCMFDPLRWRCHCASCNSWLFFSSTPSVGLVVGLLPFHCAKCLRHHIRELSETLRLACLEFKGHKTIYQYFSHDSLEQLQIPALGSPSALNRQNALSVLIVNINTIRSSKILQNYLSLRNVNESSF
jgi:hypothetical protein